jgi:hypothetical protein
MESTGENKASEDKALLWLETTDCRNLIWKKRDPKVSLGKIMCELVYYGAYLS